MKLRRHNTKSRRRLGAILSMELVLVLPIVLGLIFATIEIGMLWSSGQRVKEAAAAGSRVAGFRGADESAVRRAVEHGLGRKNLSENYTLDISHPDDNPHEVCVTVTVPMKAAAPDLLTFLGFSLEDRRLTAHSIMRRE
jgi:Flp pilus assembly protein TadG